MVTNIIIDFANKIGYRNFFLPLNFCNTFGYKSKLKQKEEFNYNSRELMVRQAHQDIEKIDLIIQGRFPYSREWQIS